VTISDRDGSSRLVPWTRNAVLALYIVTGIPLLGSAQTFVLGQPRYTVPSPTTLRTGSFDALFEWDNAVIGLHSDIGGILWWSTAGRRYKTLPNPVDVFSGPQYTQLLLTPAGVIGVDDLRSRLVLFRSSNPRGHVPSVVKMPADASDVCAFGARYAFYVPADGGSLVIADSAGRGVNVIRLPNSNVPQRDVQLHADVMPPKIGCGENPATVVVFWEDRAAMAGYAPSGRMRWNSVRADFIPIDVSYPQGAILKKTPRGGNDETVGVYPFGRSSLLVVTRHTPDLTALGNVPHFNSILIDVGSGQTKGRIATSKRVVGTGRGIVFIEGMTTTGDATAVRLEKERE
jgi:hypothetical protein